MAPISKAQKLRARLARIAVSIGAKLDEAAAAHPDDPRIDPLREALATAKDALASAKTPGELRAAWAQLRTVRQALETLGTSPTTSTPTTSTPTTSTPTASTTT